MTSNTRPEHTLLARQNRCLQGVRKSSGAGVSHTVAFEVQFFEGGVRLVIFHSAHAGAHAAACVLSHTTAPVRSKYCMQGNACEDARNVCATARPVRSTRTYPLPLRKNMTPGTLSRGTRCHATSTFANWYPNCGTTWTALKLFRFHSHVNQIPHNWHRDEACHFIWLRGEARHICVNVLE